MRYALSLGILSVVCTSSVSYAESTQKGGATDETSSSSSLSDPASPEASCVFGTDYLRVGNRSDVKSNLGSNGWIEVQAGSQDNRTVIDGNILSRGWARIGLASTVGDVTSGSWVEVQQGAKTGVVTQYATVPSVVLSTKSVTVGTTDVTLQNPPNCTRQLAPGLYRNITVQQGCRLTLAAGSYSASTFTINAGGSLELLGNVSVNVNGAFSFGDRSVLLGATKPDGFSVYSNQSIRIGTDTAFTGMLYAPKGDGTIAARTSYTGCLRALRTGIEPDARLYGIPPASCNPALNSVKATHGNDEESDWHRHTANAFLYGTNMDGVPIAANFTPASWTKSHIHTGLHNTAHFYYDRSISSIGDDTDATSGIDTEMMLFYAGHGSADSFSALGESASPAQMKLGNCSNNGHLRYYWQCSCEVFAHGPETCPSGGWAYACPDRFDGSADSTSMRNVYQRWGAAVSGGYLRMACGASTSAYCWQDNTNQIWDNYNNLGLDVADSFIYGLHNYVDSPVVPICLTTGGSDVTQTPLYDTTFTTAPNLGGDYYHIQFMSQFATTPRVTAASYPSGDLPVLSVNSFTGLQGGQIPADFVDSGDYYVSKPAATGGEIEVLIHKTTGATYYRGKPDRPALAKEALADTKYVAEAAEWIRVLGWSGETVSDVHGTRTMISTTPKAGGDSVLYQKNTVIVFPRVIDVGGTKVPVIGAGGKMVVQLNSNGGLAKASKVWRQVSLGAAVPLKPYATALAEAQAALGSAATQYRLDSWDWGYKEEAGSVPQQDMRVALQFRFVAIAKSANLAPRTVEVKAQ